MTSAASTDDQPLVGFAGLWRALNAGTPLADLVSDYQRRLTNNPCDAAALLDLATLLMFLMDAQQRALANELQNQAMALQRVYRLPLSRPPALRLLVIMAALELRDLTANTPVDCLLLDSDIAITQLYVADNYPLPAQLPAHDLVYVAVGESDRSAALLQHLDAGLPALTNRPIINAPRDIGKLGRVWVAENLQNQPAIDMPVTRRVARAVLEKVVRGGSVPAGVGGFPIIVRPVDSHGGSDLARLENREQLRKYLSKVRWPEFYLARFVDYRNADGQYRKFRVALIDGHPYACHMAISSHWMVHYLNAHMDASSTKRDEECQFMADFDTGFAVRHANALAAIQHLVGLDYVGIDCAELADGRLLVFEIDSAMVVHANDDPTLYPYKGAVMQRLFEAFRQMLLRRAAEGSAPSPA